MLGNCPLCITNYLCFYVEVEESRAGRFLDISSGPGLLALTKSRIEGFGAG